MHKLPISFLRDDGHRERDRSTENVKTRFPITSLHSNEVLFNHSCRGLIDLFESRRRRKSASTFDVEFMISSFVPRIPIPCGFCSTEKSHLKMLWRSMFYLKLNFSKYVRCNAIG
ncbi:hypothetical protein SDJN03_03103, partial [Cucurbita argyrosperma subsp. sororia]